LRQLNITLGTAGHIDHGKTALVKCLTGCDTDRLKEEKLRGMSIELGFAPCRIADTEVGIVDVPGHENFVKTMVAGASGMDAVIFVVAADDGVMPQTREHLEILTLLGVRQGIVALTKIDRIESERRGEVIARVAAFLQGTFLAQAPILPISNVTGEGFDAFLEALWTLVRGVEPRRADGVFGLPVERGFSVPGYGTVVAGIPIAGSAQVGEEIVLLPQNLAGRVRRIEIYGQPGDVVTAGQCAALNVGQWDHREIRRGDTLTVPGFFAPQEWFFCSARLLPREKLCLKSGAELRFHVGTAEVAAMFYPLQGTRMNGGDEGLVQLRTKHAVVAGPGDHFLLRTPSPVRTVGGGVIVEAVPRRLKGSRAGVAQNCLELATAVGDASKFVEQCVRTAEGLAASESELAVRAKIPLARLRGILAHLLERQSIVGLPAHRYMHRDTAREAENRLLSMVQEFHHKSPESIGILLEDLRRIAAIDRAILDSLIANVKADGRLVEVDRHRLALPTHRVSFAGEDAKQLESIESLFQSQAFSPPGMDVVAERTGIDRKKTEKLVNILRDNGRLVQVESGLLFHRDAIDRAREVLSRHFSREDRLESVQFKYLLDTTRKFAIPLLDYFDRIGVTRRVGNTRYLKALSQR
jgi:selenocysteine-specific elongation factor